MMSTERKAELFDAAMEWIWEHTGEYDVNQYVYACAGIGYTKDEIEEELCGCGLEEEIHELLSDMDDYF